MAFKYFRHAISPKTSKKTASSRNTARTSPSKRPSHNSLYDRSDSLRNLEMVGAPESDDWEVRLAWIRSQIIGGNDVEFESLFGKRVLTYADHTASGRSLLCIEDFIMKNVLPFYGNTHTCDSHVGHQTTKMVHEAASYVKKCLGGTENDALLFCGSGTTAAVKRLQEVMGVAVASTLRERVVKTLRDEERWVVFVGPYEHHSNLLSWRQSLADVIEIGLDDEGLLDMEALRSGLEVYKNTNRPILGSFSACSNVTGIYTHTRALAKLLHQYGAFACFDFAASGPYVEIDMRSGEMDGYDAIFLSPHKFLGGPGSPGILLMSKALYRLGASPPSTSGGGTVAYVNGFTEEDTLYYEDIEERENAGTPQIIQTIRAALAFWVKEYIRYQVIERQENMYIHKALNRLLPNKNIVVLGNTNSKRQAILSFLVYPTTNPEPENGIEKALHGPFVAALLNDLFGVQARGGCACAGPYGHKLLAVDDLHSRAYRSAIKQGYFGVKPGWTRVSFPYYMSSEEFEFILAALEFIAMYGQRFLALYELNLRTGSWAPKNKALACLVNKSVKAIHPNKRDEETTKQTRKVGKFAFYLNTALEIANLLPKFPSERKLEEGFDLSFLQFRV